MNVSPIYRQICLQGCMLHYSLLTSHALIFKPLFSCSCVYLSCLATPLTYFQQPSYNSIESRHFF